MGRSAQSVLRPSRRVVIGIVAATCVAVAAPADAVARAVTDQQVAFEAGYRRGVGNNVEMVATLVVPRGRACESADGSVVTVHSYLAAGGWKSGAEVTMTCDEGSAHYSGSYFYGDGEPGRLYGRIRGGDWIRVRIQEARLTSSVEVSSVQGWRQGSSTGHPDLEDAVLTVGAAGELGAAEPSVGLAAQRFRFLRMDGKRFGKASPEAFEDGCSSTSVLRHRQAFDTTFTC